MSAVDFFIVCILAADYLIAVPAFLSASDPVLLLLGLVLAAAPVVIVLNRFFKE